MSPTFRPYDAATAFIHADVSLFLILGILMPSALYVIIPVLFFCVYVPVVVFLLLCGLLLRALSFPWQELLHGLAQFLQFPHHAR